MDINRYLRKDKLTKDGLAPIRISAIPFRKRIWLESGEKVRPAGWDERKQRVKGSEPYATQINDRLDDLEKAAEKVFRDAQKARKLLTEAEFRAAVIQEVDGELAKQREAQPVLSFFQLMEAWVQHQTHKLSEQRQQPMAITTIRGHNATMQRLREFEKFSKKPVTLEGMDQVFYLEFKRYMIMELKQSVNTFSKHVTRLKRFLDHCLEEELPVCLKYRSFSTPTQTKDVDSLTLEELQALQNIDFSSDEVLHFVQGLEAEWYRQWHWQQRVEVLERMRDVFLMLCYTGLRISDMLLLSPQHIEGDIIKVKALKTGVTCYIPYYDDDIFKPVAMVRKYKGRQKTCLPVNVQINRYLKDIQKLIKFDRFPLVTKNGRKTFVTLKLYQGVPARVIMQATGHKTESSFNYYAGINTKELVTNFQKHSKGVQIRVQI